MKQRLPKCLSLNASSPKGDAVASSEANKHFHKHFHGNRATRWKGFRGPFLTWGGMAPDGDKHVISYVHRVRRGETGYYKPCASGKSHKDHIPLFPVKNIPPGKTKSVINTAKRKKRIKWLHSFIHNVMRM